MPKKPTKKAVAQEREIPLIWDIPEDLTSGYATNILVQVGEHEFFVSFFEAQPPIILKPQDIEKLESVRAECLARLVILPERMEAFIGVLQKQLDIFKEKKKREAKPMALNESLIQTYRVSAVRALASSDYTRPVQARLVSLPSFPAQITLVGEISDNFRLVQPLAIDLEEAGSGEIIASDNVFYMYGQGATRREAVEDYVSSLSEYYELLESHDDAPSVELFRYLQSYLQPASR